MTQSFSFSWAQSTVFEHTFVHTKHRINQLRLQLRNHNTSTNLSLLLHIIKQSTHYNPNSKTTSFNFRKSIRYFLWIVVLIQINHTKASVCIRAIACKTEYIQMLVILLLYTPSPISILAVSSIPSISLSSSLWHKPVIRIPPPQKMRTELQAFPSLHLEVFISQRSSPTPVLLLPSSWHFPSLLLKTFQHSLRH